MTPTIMFATRVRDRPCSARLRRSSSGRVTDERAVVALTTVMGSATVWRSVPLDP